ncbi:ChrR family anti-sigma-E factor [Litoribrevibacter albus]|uniref:Transcriptional regulator n=1 Tax=Litoribrevibacter albus TaxID=1473156 RepID=A0AA37S7W5_9GAMM|nr:ChrR family anti-sigma-E factor [Litoribrevibacter albus]GLQ30802.1 transcriptional regulator [Litoribrevibacter albus]
MANYHPNDELLMTFTAGHLTNALGILVACHVDRCKVCQAKAHSFEQLGGDILELAEPVAVSNTTRTALLNRLNDTVKPDHKVETNPDSRVPRPLWRFIDNDLNQLNWKGLIPSIQEITLPFSNDTYTAKLFKISAGKEIAEHTHKGNEFTLVLDGAFSDILGSYYPGDFVVANTDTLHRPYAHKDKDCICFAVLDAPLKMTGLFTQLLNPFL